MNYLYNFSYVKHLRELLAGYPEIEIDEEQAFLKKKDYDIEKIYIIVKYLTSSIDEGAISQPIQLLILSEENSMEKTREIFKEFAISNNWVAYTEDYKEGNKTFTRLVKQQFAEPVVVSNFNPVAYGYRSILYVSGNLIILNKILDLKNLEIDEEDDIKAITFNISYSMTPNTQQLGKDDEFISSSTKSVSTMSISMATPLLDNEFCNKVLAIINETDKQEIEQTDNLYGGNEDFIFDFYIGSIHFENKKMKLVSFTFNTNINDVPTINLGFMK